MLKCPACNKPDQSALACQRCGCDLAALHLIRRAAEICLEQARESMCNRRWDQALAEIEQSWELYHAPEAAQCAFVLCGAVGDIAAALAWRQRALPVPAKA